MALTSRAGHFPDLAAEMIVPIQYIKVEHNNESRLWFGDSLSYASNSSLDTSTTKLEHLASVCAMTQSAEISLPGGNGEARKEQEEEPRAQDHHHLSKRVKKELDQDEWPSDHFSTSDPSHHYNHNLSPHLPTTTASLSSGSNVSSSSPTSQLSSESSSMLAYSTEFVASIFEQLVNDRHSEFQFAASAGPQFNLMRPRIAYVAPVALSCDACEPSFRSNPRIQWHRRATEKFCNECTICGGPFIPTHEARKPNKRGFECHRCSSTFDRADRLLAHSRVHTGIKAYACLYCPRMFSRKDRWSSHMKKEHNASA